MDGRQNRRWAHLDDLRPDRVRNKCWWKASFLTGQRHTGERRHQV